MSIYTLGIDIGSTASKCIILKDGKDIVAKSLVDVGAGTTGPARAISEVLESANMKREDLAFTLATGYGRNSLEGIADKQMSELSCHAMGAHFLWPNVHTVIDIGGQDAKVIHIENGAMTNFQMNDKCAAGTGRFLDVMARVLEVKVSDLAPLGAQSTKRVPISSTCTVFAESEVISQLSKGTNRHHCRYPSFRCQPCHWSCQPRRGFSRRGHDRWGGTKLRHCPCIGGRPWRRNQDISLGPVQWGLGSGSLCISKGEQVSAQLDEKKEGSLWQKL